MEEKKKVNRKKDKQVLLRMTEEQKEIFDENVLKSGLSQNEFLLACALQKEIKQSKDLEQLKELIISVNKIGSELGKWGSNLNQIARNVNSDGVYVEMDIELTAIRKEIINMDSELKKLFNLAFETLNKL